ncbi:prephenate dehydrogenase/arogenate dehydrogenase family protein [Rubinisphaera sp.]|uniref:prephenate dehydrogenase n=1 Tax=Rubinisphaera sp. TaxID=2024857 RepID=UPI000C105FEA|nr:prephenate dehydrogenase/arogenate dehydrogenase family protein [Rubinisphaera sp.]MBV07838.1 prephenate dehydrogenase [Rubinisphaera sp.]HCS54521.1 prephenate dehydrogenase/arogenate dehydrogenase family protein [Planctomycetaceae bacterium]|tara:strand:+ start:3877 stop:4761 length:885 start_codon:yes stop_codon:yes gene_type:complete
MKPVSEKPELSVQTLAIRGVGLIGGSIAKAARKARIVQEIIGIGRDEARLQKAVEHQIIDRFETDSKLAASQADLIVVCTPVDCIAQDIIQLHSGLRPEALITDAGSVKEQIVREVAEKLGAGHRYLGSHPLAGSEKTGFEHAEADLFQNAVVVLTPEEQSSKNDLKFLETFWKSLGGKITIMSPAEHDRALAATSHLPHLIAAALASSVPEDQLPLAATGFGDTTRIASGDPHLWTSIFCQNSNGTLAAAKEFQQQLNALLDAVEAKDTDKINTLLKAAKTRRDLWQQDRNNP